MTITREQALQWAKEAQLHPKTADLVARFAQALAEKLCAAEKKYGYSDGWASDDWMDECRAKMLEHVHKGDPRDVAAYCAFLWHHGEHTKPVEAQPVYCVATGYDTYEHHKQWVPNADCFVLYAAPPSTRELVEALREARGWMNMAVGESWAVHDRVNPVLFDRIDALLAKYEEQP